MPYHDKTRSIKIAIADDHSLVRQAFRDHLNKYPEFEVLVETEDGGKLLRILQNGNIQIDVLLLDIFSPKMDGRETLKIISKYYPGIHVLILSASTDQKIISATLELGALGFVSKTAEPEELYEAILSVAEGKVFKNKFYHLHHNSTFTPIEIRVLELIWMEKTNEEIARVLHMSVSAIEKIKHQLKEKTGSKSTVGIIKYALERRIINPDQY
ncbi:MAG: response regulator transcription factor [Chitinophagaceae bacterium]|nr:response regulator transcription factor [Chitinophagaceae bacterium]